MLSLDRARVECAPHDIKSDLPDSLLEAAGPRDRKTRPESERGSDSRPYDTGVQLFVKRLFGQGKKIFLLKRNQCSPSKRLLLKQMYRYLGYPRGFVQKIRFCSEIPNSVQKILGVICRCSGEGQAATIQTNKHIGNCLEGVGRLLESLWCQAAPAMPLTCRSSCPSRPHRHKRWLGCRRIWCRQKTAFDRP